MPTPLTEGIVLLSFSSFAFELQSNVSSAATVIDERMLVVLHAVRPKGVPSECIWLGVAETAAAVVQVRDSIEKKKRGKQFQALRVALL